MKRNIFNSIVIFIVFCFSACNDLIDYSPFDTDVRSNYINVNNVERIIENGLQEDTVRFALIADSHTSYDDLRDAVKSINKEEGLCFVASCGDVTDGGLSQEYKWYRDIINDLKYPAITVIGNHDYLSNGYIVYKRMFGPSNMTFYCGEYKFIVFDDVVWENNNSRPDFEWLRAELVPGKTSKYNILLAHIPPWTDQLEGEYRDIFENILKENNVLLSMYGHEHAFEQREFGGVPAIVSGCVKDRFYNIIKLYKGQFKLERRRF